MYKIKCFLFGHKSIFEERLRVLDIVRGLTRIRVLFCYRCKALYFFGEIDSQFPDGIYISDDDESATFTASVKQKNKI